MATPRLSKSKRIEIERELKMGKSHRQIAKDLNVAIGTVSNVRNGLFDSEVEMNRLKMQVRQAEREYDDAVKEIGQLKKELALFTSASDYARHFQPINIQPKHGGKGEATAVVCVNDWHFEERVSSEAVNGVNEFNLDIAAKRSKQLWETAASLVDMCRSRSVIQTVIVNILGDLITGYIHDELIATNELAPSQALLRVFDQLVSGLDYLQKETKAEILVPCVCGNHGRFTKKRWAKQGPGVSFENILYNIMARWFEAKKNSKIRFLLPQGDMTYYKIYDKNIRITHGDNIRYAGGIGGVHIPLRKAVDVWNTQVRADYNYFGHWHTDLTGEDYRISGSLIGFNEYSIKIKARYQKPSQAFELQHPRYGATARFPIIL
jgi:hypothetical protein